MMPRLSVYTASWPARRSATLTAMDAGWGAERGGGVIPKVVGQTTTGRAGAVVDPPAGTDDPPDVVEGAVVEGAVVEGAVVDEAPAARGTDVAGPDDPLGDEPHPPRAPASSSPAAATTGSSDHAGQGRRRGHLLSAVPDPGAEPAPKRCLLVTGSPISSTPISGRASVSVRFEVIGEKARRL